MSKIMQEEYGEGYKKGTLHYKYVGKVLEVFTVGKWRVMYRGKFNKARVLRILRINGGFIPGVIPEDHKFKEK